MYWEIYIYIYHFDAGLIDNMSVGAMEVLLQKHSIKLFRSLAFASEAWFYWFTGLLVYQFYALRTGLPLCLFGVIFTSLQFQAPEGNSVMVYSVDAYEMRLMATVLEPYSASEPGEGPALIIIISCPYVIICARFQNVSHIGAGSIRSNETAEEKQLDFKNIVFL